MTAIRPMFGSDSTDGKMVAITQTATAGNSLHDAITGTNHIDEVYIYGCNIHTAAVKVTFEIGGTAAANQMTYTIPAADGYHLLIPGIRLQNAANIAAFAGTTAVVNMIVLVNRIIDPETAS